MGEIPLLCYLALMKNLTRLLMLPFGAALMGIAAGTPAPNFSAKNQDGKTVKLSDFAGKFVLIYFYPKDDTPGCTKEACSFRDNHGKLKEMNTVILGVSRQDEKSHQKFIAKHKLPFDLLVDDKGEIAASFGVGLIPIIGIHKRQSVLIAPDGKVLKHYEGVDPDSHVADVMADVQAAKK